MAPFLRLFFVLCWCTTLAQQNKLFLDVTWDGMNSPLEIQQQITWQNTTNTEISSVFLLDWNHAYSDAESPLGVYMANNYEYKLIRSTNKNRGYTKIKAIDNAQGTLRWKRLANQIDVVEVLLPQAVAPNQSISFRVDYTVKLPELEYFREGKSKNNELFSNHWHLQLAPIDKQGYWETKSNLGINRQKRAQASVTYSFNLPKNITRILPADDQNDFDASKLVLTTTNKYTRYPFGKTTLLTDMLPKDGLDATLRNSINSIANFVFSYFPQAEKELISAFQYDYKQNKIIGLDVYPDFLKVFTKQQQLELALLKTILVTVINDSFGCQEEESNWLLQGITHYLWQQYVSRAYPDLRMTGSLGDWPFMKNYHLTQAPFFRSWELATNVSASKNRGQSLTTAANKLTQYNLKIANPSRAGLALLFLGDYLEGDVLNTAIKSLTPSNRMDIELQNSVKKISKKPVDWFFEHYIHLDNNGDISLSGKKLSDGAYQIDINSKKIKHPIPLETTSVTGVKTISWVHKSQLPYRKIYNTNEIASLVVNKHHLIPEERYSNNSYNFKNGFANGKLRMRFFQDIPKSGTQVLLVTPEIGYNLYDGFLSGITLGNSTMLNNFLRYKLSPKYGAKSKKINGSGFVMGSFYHNKKSHYLTRLTLFGSSFHYAPKQRYSVFAPSAQLYYRPDGLQSNKRSYLLFKHVSIHLEDLPATDERKNYGVNLLSFNSESGNALKNRSYKIEFQQAKSFTRTSAEMQFTKYYQPNRRINLRVFMGGFINNKTSDDYFDFSLSRVNDYLFQYDLYGRSEREGLYSQQYIKADGGLRSIGAVKRVNQWLVTTQATTTLWRWIEGYGEVGWYKNKEVETAMHWGTGVSFNLIPDFFEIHFPVADATGTLINKSTYASHIRFQLSLRPASLAQLFSRSWF